MPINNADHLHKFEVKGEQFILNIPASRFYKINSMMAQIIDLLQDSRSPGEIIESLGQQYPREEISRNIENLVKTGLLSYKDNDEPFIPPMERPLDTLDLQVSHHCNLRCRYCYAGGGNFGKKDKLMTANTARKAVDFFMDHTNGKDELSLSFDGGEPMINFDVIKEAVSYAAEKGEKRDQPVRFSIGTNATLVTEEIADFFSRHRFSPQFSLDGPEHIHDELRPLKNGKGSYRQLLEGIQQFDKKGVKLASRITLTPKNLRLRDYVEQLHEMGVIRIAAFPATGIPGEYAFGPADIDTLKEEYDKTAEFFLDTLFKTGKYVKFANITDNLKNLHKAQVLHFGCGAARKFISIDPYEDIYPCHRLVGNKKYRLGDLKTGINREKRRLFLDNHVDSKEKCRDCWAKYLCGGGCLVEADHANGDIKTPYDVTCEILKYEKELSMMIYARIHAEDKSLLERIP